MTFDERKMSEYHMHGGGEGGGGDRMDWMLREFDVS